jgi:hypothetical protein
MIVPSRRLGVCLIALGRSSRKGGQGRSQPGGLGRKQQASLEITAAAKQHAVVARSFCEPAKRQPAGKRSPATIYGDGKVDLVTSTVTHKEIALVFAIYELAGPAAARTPLPAGNIPTLALSPSRATMMLC